jgi:glutamate N-acetyltransferase/amino-acid N-acetyltransferase
MPVNYATPAPEALFPVAGLRLGTAEAGIRKKGRRDLTLVELAPGSRAAGVFTQNRCCAAPVTVCRAHLAGDGSLRALVINTGIANAGTGEQGMRAARATCEAVAGAARLRGARSAAVFDRRDPRTPAGRSPGRRFAGGQGGLKADNWHAAAHAIMTTDTVAKVRRAALSWAARPSPSPASARAPA